MNQEELRKASVAYQDRLLDSGSHRGMSISDHFEAGAEWEEERGKWNEVGHPTNLNYPNTQPYEVIYVLTYGYDDAYVAKFVDGEFYDKQDQDEYFNDVCISTLITHWQYITPPKTSKQ